MTQFSAESLIFHLLLASHTSLPDYFNLLIRRDKAIRKGGNAIRHGACNLTRGYRDGPETGGAWEPLVTDAR
jgi:hypothetical protein